MQTLESAITNERSFLLTGNEREILRHDLGSALGIINQAVREQQNVDDLNDFIKTFLEKHPVSVEGNVLKFLPVPEVQEPVGRSLGQ